MRKAATIGLIFFLAGVTAPVVRGVAPAYAQANPEAWADWQHWLSKHPGLRQNPQWLSDPNYRKAHPLIIKWLGEHPGVMQESRQEGMWDRDGRWRNSSWWHDNDPDSAWKHHPEWAEKHQDWRGANDGDLDDQHHWRARNWWLEHHPDWVKDHHPNWYIQRRSNEPLQHPGHQENPGHQEHND